MSTLETGPNSQTKSDPLCLVTQKIYETDSKNKTHRIFHYYEPEIEKKKLQPDSPHGYSPLLSVLLLCT